MRIHEQFSSFYLFGLLLTLDVERTVTTSSGAVGAVLAVLCEFFLLLFLELELTELEDVR